VLDYLARTGIVGTALLLTCLAVVAVMAVGAARRGSPIAIGLVVVLAACAVTEVLINWEFLATSTVILWVAAIASLDREASGEQTSGTRHVDDSPRVDEGFGGG
jgi:O-antigen ligase